MKPEIVNPLADDVARLLGGVRDGHRYRITVEHGGITRSGLVRASVEKPRIDIRPGNVTFVMDGETLNENMLYPGPIDHIVSITEVPDAPA